MPVCALRCAALIQALKPMAVASAGRARTLRRSSWPHASAQSTPHSLAAIVDAPHVLQDSFLMPSRQ